MQCNNGTEMYANHCFIMVHTAHILTNMQKIQILKSCNILIKAWTAMDCAFTNRQMKTGIDEKGIVIRSSVVSQRPCKVREETRLD